MVNTWNICSEVLNNNDTQRLDFIEWGTDVSLYNPCSGNTHLLNLFPYEILQFLLLKPASLTAISEHMAVLCDEKNDEKWNEKILKLLMQLKELELIDYQN